MFNLSGSELIFLIVIALIVLGPDKLPDAMRRAGKAYADFKKMTTGFQSEMNRVLEEPLRELRETADLAKKSAMFDMNSEPKQVSATMGPVPGEPPRAADTEVAADAPAVGAVEPSMVTPLERNEDDEAASA